MATITTAFPGISSTAYTSDPYKFIDQIAGARELVYDPTLSAYICANMRTARQILSDETTFSTAPLADRAEPVMRGRVLAQMIGDEHATLKRRFLAHVSRRALAEVYQPRLASLAHELFGAVDTSTTFDVMKDYANGYAVLATFCLLDISSSEQHWITAALSDIAKFATGFAVSEEIRTNALAAAAELDEFIRSQVDARRGDQSLIAHLSQYVERGEMSIEELVSLTLNILLAAAEPTDKTIGYASYHLASSAALRGAIADESALISDCAAETLRLTPPVHLLPRRIERTTEIAGTQLNIGDIVLCHIAACNRDPEAFPDPTVFRLDREAGTGNRPYTGAARHLSFGHGLHFCIGSIFGKEAIVSGLSPVFHWLRDNPHAQIDNLTARGTYTRGPYELTINPTSGHAE